MKQNNPIPRKLSEISEKEGIVAFLLAIFQGADINEQVKRERVRKKSLVEDLFHRIWIASNLAAPLMQTMIKRYKALVLFGADTGNIIESAYQPMVKSVCKDLMLLEVLLENTSAKEAIRSNSWRLPQLKGLQQCLDRVSGAITASGLVAGMEDVPEPWDLQIEQNRLIAEASSITGSPEEDFKRMLERMREIHEHLEQGDQPEDEDTSFDLFG